MKKRIGSLLLALVLCLGLIPLAGAAEAGKEHVYWGDQELTKGADGIYDCPYQLSEQPVYLIYDMGEKLNGIQIDTPNGFTLCESENDHSVKIRVFLPIAVDFVLPLIWKNMEGATQTIRIHFHVKEAASSHPVAKENLFKGQDARMGATKFQLDGKTYYLGVIFRQSWVRDHQPLNVRSHSDLIEHGQAYGETMVLELGVWTKDDMGYHDVTDREVLEQLQNPCVALYATKEKNQYPMMVSEKHDYPCTRIYHMTENNNNVWIAEASATVSGKEIVTRGSMGWDIRKPYPENPMTVEQVNTWLKDLDAEVHRLPDENYTYNFLLKSNVHGGTIKVPAGIKQFIRITGIRDGGEQTTLTGVEANSPTILQNIKFVSSGKSDKFDLDKWDEDTDTNCGFYGSAMGQYNRCSFEGYDVAVKCTEGLRFGGQECTFKNNHVGIYVDAETTGGGNAWMTEFMFENNDCAVYVDDLDETLEPWEYQIKNCRFINNGVDIINEEAAEGKMESWLFFPGNYFEYSERSADTPKVVGKVSLYPVAADSDFKSLDHGERKATVANQLTAQYPIPADQLDGKELTIVDSTNTGDKTLAQMVFPEAEAPTIRMMRAAEEPKAFDATVQVDRTADTITFTMQNPQGKNPEISIPCTWTEVKVRHGDTVVESKADGQNITFTAAEGGTYMIFDEESPAEPVFPINPVRPEPPQQIGFFDVNRSDWYYDSVQIVTERGLMKGVSETQFAPNDQASRAMILTMLARLEKTDLTGGDTWYEKAVAWAVTQGISDGTAPERAIIRQQLVTMLWRYAGSPKAEGGLARFRDADQVAAYAQTAMIWAVSNGIISGMGDNTLNPNGTATRAQIAQIFCNYLNLAV